MKSRAHELKLPGLRDDNPRDFLAALGLLRLVAHRWPDAGARLSWAVESGIPSLTTAVPLPAGWGAELWQLLKSWRAAEPNIFGHGKIEAIEPSIFRKLLASNTAVSSVHRVLYPSLAAQIAREGSGRRSEFIIESANRSVLKGIDDLLALKRNIPDVAAEFAGTGQRAVVSNTSRWHPAEFQAAAYTATDPKENKHNDFRSLNIFALFGLTFYPVVDSTRGRQTCGIARPDKAPCFSWPVWNNPLGIDEIGSLVLHPLIHESAPDGAALRATGVHQVWTSRKFCPDGKNDYFSTGQPKL